MIVCVLVLSMIGVPLPESQPVSDPVMPAHAPLMAAQTSSTPVKSAQHRSLRGWATWFAAPRRTGAAGPALRHLLGRKWRGSGVEVCRGERCVLVRLTDWCACGKRHGQPTLIDLSPDAFARLGPLSRGVLHVRISGAIGLPATDAR